MNTRLPLIAVSLAAACSAAFASTEYGNVVSSKAVIAKVALPRQQCTEQQVVAAPRTSGGGALLGALVGGVVGHGMGQGMGRAAATGLGLVTGSVIGDRAEAVRTPAETAPVLSCQTVDTFEDRVVGYDVTYEYHGQRYTTRLAQDPGERIALNVSATPQQGAAAAPAAGVAPAAATVFIPAAVASYPVSVVAPVVAPAYGSPFAPRVGVLLGSYWHHGR